MIPFYKMQLDPSLEGMDFNAVVTEPAHMKSYETFKKALKKGKKVQAVKDHFNEEKMIVTGVAIAVDLPIYRNDNELGEHYVYFTAEDTEEIWIEMMEKQYLHNVNNMHDADQEISGMVMFESYRIDKDGGLYPEMFKDQNLKDGSIVVSYKAKTKEAWAKVKENTGFSIEGWFKKVPVKMKGQFSSVKKTGKIVGIHIPVKKDRHGSVIQAVEKWDIDVINDDIAIGDELHYSWIDVGGVEMDGGRVQDGEYIHDGRKIQVDSNGIVVMIDGSTELSISKSKNSKMKKKSFLAKVFGKTALGSATTVNGIEIFWDGDLEEGKEIRIENEEGEQVLAPEGDHTFANEDGTMTVVTVDGNGIATNIETVEAEPDMEDMEEQMAKALKKIIADNKTAMDKVKADNKAAIEKAVSEAKEEMTAEVTRLSGMLETLCKELDESAAAQEALEKLKGNDDDDANGGDDGKARYRKFLNKE